MNKFSIIIPTYNEKKNILILINKITKYTKNFTYEIIVVDDNSNDGSENIFKKIKTNKKNFFFL